MRKIPVIVIMSAIGFLMVDCLVYIVTGYWLEIAIPSMRTSVNTWPVLSLQDRLIELQGRFVLVFVIAFLGWVWRILYQEFIE